MTLLLTVVVFCSVAAAVTFAQAVATRRQVRASLARAAGIVAPVSSQELTVRGRHLPLVARLARLALAARPGLEREELAMRLAAAGAARRVSPDAFLALQALALLGSVALGLAVAAGGSTAGGFVLALAGIALTLVVPERILKSVAAQRGQRVLAELPGALDLLAICVEAGLGFDAAVARVADVTVGPLADELRTMLAEIRVGEARNVALQRLADRVGVNDVAVFARAVVRADQLGTPLGHTLRIQASDARARRQLAAEEKAGKAPVKMLFPTIIFIFPALFVIVLGPAVVSLGSFFK